MSDTHLPVLPETPALPAQGPSPGVPHWRSGSASVDFSSIARLREKVNDLVDDSPGARDIRSALACIGELEEHGRALRHSRDYWHDREKDARELIADVLCGSVDAGVYPDGPCLDRELRARIKAYLSEPNGEDEPRRANNT